MTTPLISIIATASRPENWMELYKSIGENDVSFEVIFVGPNEPNFQLPTNFNFIKSNVKPAQCVEIASRHASGDFIIPVADDVLFTTQHPLDKYYKAYVDAGAGNTVASAEYKLDPGWNRFFHNNTESPLMPFCGLIPTRLWRELGGIDSQFIAVSWDLDLAMRIFAAGGQVVMAGVFIGEEIELPGKPRSRGSTLHRDYWPIDRVLLDKLWSVDGKVHFNRTSPVIPFSDEDILVRSQEPQGRWHYQSALMNKVITGRTYYKLRGWRSIIRGRFHRFKISQIPMYLKRLVRG